MPRKINSAGPLPSPCSLRDCHMVYPEGEMDFQHDLMAFSDCDFKGWTWKWHIVLPPISIGQSS